MMKKAFYISTIIIIILALSFIFWIQINRFSPKLISTIQIENTANKSLKHGDSLGILLWNISYGGMPEQMDFFYSGGIELQLNKKESLLNFKSILSQLLSFIDSTDIFLFHKVDTLSDRSYEKNQYQEIRETLPDYEAAYCLNFSNPFIPVPLDQPIGKLSSGMLSMSHIHASSYERISLHTQQQYFWPKRLFTAQKCVSMASYPVEDKNLYIINVHLNSYDWQGEIRLAQLELIEKLADSLYELGNFVIIGGGWNMNPPGFKKYNIGMNYKGKPNFPAINSSIYFSNWQFEYDKQIPTSRSLKEAYRHGAISTTIKDFFICSPNVNIMMTKTISQKFKWSDHHPVYLRVLLLPTFE